MLTGPKGEKRPADVIVICVQFLTAAGRSVAARPLTFLRLGMTELRPAAFTGRAILRACHALPHEPVSCGGRTLKAVHDGTPLKAFHFCLFEALGLFGEPRAFMSELPLCNRLGGAQGADDSKRSDQSFHVDLPAARVGGSPKCSRTLIVTS